MLFSAGIDGSAQLAELIQAPANVVGVLYRPITCERRTDLLESGVVGGSLGLLKKVVDDRLLEHLGGAPGFAAKLGKGNVLQPVHLDDQGLVVSERRQSANQVPIEEAEIPVHPGPSRHRLGECAPCDNCLANLVGDRGNTSRIGDTVVLQVELRTPQQSLGQHLFQVSGVGSPPHPHRRLIGCRLETSAPQLEYRGQAAGDGLKASASEMVLRGCVATQLVDYRGHVDEPAVYGRAKFLYAFGDPCNVSGVT